MSLLDALRGLNLGLPVRQCPECAERLQDEYPKAKDRPPVPLMERDYVRAPRLQDHWRGVEADVCPGCGYYEYAKHVYAPD